MRVKGILSFILFLIATLVVPVVLGLIWAPLLVGYWGALVVVYLYGAVA